MSHELCVANDYDRETLVDQLIRHGNEFAAGGRRHLADRVPVGLAHPLRDDPSLAEGEP